MRRAGSCSGVQQHAGAGGHRRSPPAHGSILPVLLGLGTGRKDLTEERLLGFFSFFKIYSYFKCRRKDLGCVHYQMDPCISVCEGRLKFSPRTPPSRVQLGLRGMAPMEEDVSHFLPLLFVSKTPIKSKGAHSGHIPRGG